MDRSGEDVLSNGTNRQCEVGFGICLGGKVERGLTASSQNFADKREL